MEHIEIYQSDDGALQLSVPMREESVWLSQAQMCELFDKNKRTISEHIRNIFKDAELDENQVVRNFRTTACDQRYGPCSVNLAGGRIRS